MGPFLQVAGQWQIVQTNSFRVTVIVDQDEDRLSAFASHSNGTVTSTEATGFVQGGHFDLTIVWNNGTKGHYTADLTPFIGQDLSVPGFLKGSTQDLNHTDSTANWFSEGRSFQVT
jgi:hypothetical protein